MATVRHYVVGLGLVVAASMMVMGCAVENGEPEEADETGEAQQADIAGTCGTAPANATDTNRYMWGCTTGFNVTSPTTYGSATCPNAFVYYNNNSGTTASNGALVSAIPASYTNGSLGCQATRVNASVFDSSGALVRTSSTHGVWYDGLFSGCYQELDSGSSPLALTGPNQRVVAQATQAVFSPLLGRFVTQYRPVTISVQCAPR